MSNYAQKKKWITIPLIVTLLLLLLIYSQSAQPSRGTTQSTKAKSSWQSSNDRKLNPKARFFQKPTCPSQCSHPNTFSRKTSKQLCLFNDDKALYRNAANRLYRWLILTSLDYFPLLFSYVFQTYYQFTKSLLKTRKIPKKELYYHVNFANIHGGAKVLMESSKGLHGTSKILQEKLDTYMYTSLETPFTFIIGLTEEVAIDQIIITSNQMYSRSVKDIKIEGKFTLKDSYWVTLGTFSVEQSFHPQAFATQDKVVRYIKVTILSAHQKWTYLTLTQFQVHGKGLFADAVSTDYGDHQSRLSKSNQLKASNTCESQFKEFMLKQKQKFKPGDDNLITNLLNKIEELEIKNLIQTERMSQMDRDSINLVEMIKDHQSTKVWEFYALSTSIALSFIAILALICLWCLPKREVKLKKTPSNQNFSDSKSAKMFR